MKVLITGSKGQLGRALNKILRAKKDVSIVLTDLDEMDITHISDVERVMQTHMPDVVVNCAAHTAVDLCEDDKENAYQINVIGAENLAKVSNEIGAKIIHLSTDYVFDGELNKPYIEEDMTNPQSVYGVTKLESEQRVIANNPKYFIIRTAWLYGEGNNFVRKMLELADKVKHLKVVNDQFGSPTSAAQVAEAIVMLMDTEEYGIYHGTCEGECSWYEFAKEIFELKKVDVKLEPCTSDQFPMKAKRPKYSVLDNKNFRERFNYRFTHWKDEIKSFFEQ